MRRRTGVGQCTMAVSSHTGMGAVPYRGPEWLPEMKKMDVQVA